LLSGTFDTLAVIDVVPDWNTQIDKIRSLRPSVYVVNRR
jgi:hypothetical protein